MIDKKLFGILFVLLLINFVSANFYYEFGLDFDRGNIDVNSVDVILSQQKDFLYNYHNESDGFYITIVDRNNLILDKIFFSPPNFLIYDFVDENGNINGGEIVVLDENSFVVNSEYFDNGYKAIVYDPFGNELDSILISQFAKSGFSVKDFSEIDDKEKEVIFEEKKKDNSLEIPDKDYQIYIIGLIAILIILVIILVYSLRKKK